MYSEQTLYGKPLKFELYFNFNLGAIMEIMTIVTLVLLGLVAFNELSDH